MTWSEAIGALSVVLVLVGTWITARFSARTADQANKTADWDTFTKQVQADNQRLRERVEVVEQVLDELRVELRSRNRQIDDMSDELDDFREYTFELRDVLQTQDPTLLLPEPPSRIARHFLPPRRKRE